MMPRMTRPQTRNSRAQQRGHVAVDGRVVAGCRRDAHVPGRTSGRLARLNVNEGAVNAGTGPGGARADAEKVQGRELEVVELSDLEAL
jgi:hypothetical protein